MKKNIKLCSIIIAVTLFSSLTSASSFFEVDSLVNIYPDVEVELSKVEAGDVPKNSIAVFQFVLRCSEEKQFKLSDLLLSSSTGQSVKPSFNIYEVVPVHLEANSQGGGKTVIGNSPPDSWKPYLIRTAPFDISEVLVARDTFKVVPNVNTVILCEINIPEKYQSGLCDGVIVLDSNGEKSFCSFRFTIHDTVLNDSAEITPQISHWLSILPEDLVAGQAPQAWSQSYWKLLEKAAIELKAYGDTVATPELFSEDLSLIDITIEKDGSYSFDFSKLDRFIEIFMNAGFKQFDAACIIGGHWVFPYNVYAYDKRKSEKVTILAENTELRELIKKIQSEYKAPQSWEVFAQTSEYQASLAEMEEFLRLLMPSLYKHISQKGWLGMYRQQLLDEPRRVADYKWASQLCRELMPGVKIVNAIHGYRVDDPSQFTPYVDVWIMEHSLLKKDTSKEIIKQRKALGLETGMYNLGEPPMPNRRLDRPIINSRLEAWLMNYYGCNYYIHWAANRYRGLENEFQKSIGPIPKVKWPKGYAVGTPENPGHSPGNNWFYYRGENGLQPGLRMVAFREGITDLKLLNMLKQSYPQKADEIAAKIVRSWSDYGDSSESYYKARREILEILEE